MFELNFRIRNFHVERHLYERPHTMLMLLVWMCFCKINFRSCHQIFFTTNTSRFNKCDYICMYCNISLLPYASGIARLTDEVQWPSSDLYSDPVEGIGGQDSDTIDSYSDESFSDISVHTSPEIGRRPQIDWLEIKDSGGTTCSPGSPEATKLLRTTKGRADSAEMKGKGWKKRRLNLQTSTPVCRRTLAEVGMCMYMYSQFYRLRVNSDTFVCNYPGAFSLPAGLLIVE